MLGSILTSLSKNLLPESERERENFNRVWLNWKEKRDASEKGKYTDRVRETESSAAFPHPLAWLALGEWPGWKLSGLCACSFCWLGFISPHCVSQKAPQRASMDKHCSYPPYTQPDPRTVGKCHTGTHMETHIYFPIHNFSLTPLWPRTSGLHRKP